MSCLADEIVMVCALGIQPFSNNALVKIPILKISLKCCTIFFKFYFYILVNNKAYKKTTTNNNIRINDIPSVILITFNTKSTFRYTLNFIIFNDFHVNIIRHFNVF